MEQVLTNLLKCMGFGKVLLVYYIQSFPNSEDLLCVDRDITILLSDQPSFNSIEWMKGGKNEKRKERKKARFPFSPSLSSISATYTN